MSADNSTEWLIDALYPEESDDAESYELAPEDHVQRLEMEQLLGTMREHLPVVSPSGDMRQTLLLAAQEALTQEVEQDAAAHVATASRAPNIARTPSTSGWRRSKVHALAQIAGVAVVLILGVIFVAKLQHSALDEAGMTSHDLLASKESAPSPAVATHVEPSDFPDKAMGDAEDKSTSIEGASQTVALGELKKEDTAINEERAPKEVQDAARTRRAPAKTKKRSKAKSSSSKVASIFDGFSSRGSGKAAYGNKANEAMAAPNSPELAQAQPAKQSSIAAEKEHSVTAKMKPSKDSLAMADSAEPSVQTPEAGLEPTPSRASASRAPSAAPRAQTQSIGRTAQKADSKPAAKSATSKGLSKPGSGVPTYDSIQRSARSERHNNTLSQADGYLKSGQGSVTQRARVMELKAQALRGLGRAEEANRILTSIREKYPSYYKKQNLRKKKKVMKPKRSSMSESEAF